MTPIECLMCGRPHDSSFSQRFCSNSCRWVYEIRRRLGLWVKKG